MRFAYPEDLISAGMGSSTFDYVYVNNAINLFFDQGAALVEFARVLKPGGCLILETVYASSERGDDFIEAAKNLGNSVQAALTESQVRGLLDAAGLEVSAVVDSYDVERDRGYKAGERVEAVSGDDGVGYKSVTLNAVKR